MLNFSYSQIKNSRNPLTHVDEDVELSKDFFDRSKELLEDAKNVHVSGDFFYDDPFVTGNFTVEADVIETADKKIYIPIKGKAESLNAAVAAGIMISFFISLQLVLSK